MFSRRPSDHNYRGFLWWTFLTGRLYALIGFHLCESCLKLNEDCLKKFVDENAKEGVTEDVAELKLIMRTTDELVDAIKEQGRQVEELQQNLKELNKFQ